MQNFTLKFGKYKGEQFFSTPKSYQNWLLNQEWFKVPNQLDEVQKASKEISQLSSQLKNWNGHSKNGSAIYDNIFEAEKRMDDAIFNNPSQLSTFYNGDW